MAKKKRKAKPLGEQWAMAPNPEVVMQRWLDLGDHAEVARVGQNVALRMPDDGSVHMVPLSVFAQGMVGDIQAAMAEHDGLGQACEPVGLQTDESPGKATPHVVLASKVT